MPWHVLCHHHSQYAASQGTLACSQEALKWKDGGCQALEKVPAGSPQGRGGRIPNPVGEEAGSFSFLLLMMCAERRNSLCPTLQEGQGIQGGVLWGNDLRLARGWAFAWEETDVAFVCHTACVHKESQKQKALVLLSTSTISASLVKVSCLKQWQQEEKSTKTPAVGNHNTVDLETQILFIIIFPCWLSTFTPGSLVAWFLKVSAFADSQHQMCRIRHWTFTRLLKSYSVAVMLLLPSVSAIHYPRESKMGAVFSHTSFLYDVAKGTDL